MLKPSMQSDFMPTGRLFHRAISTPQFFLAPDSAYGVEPCTRHTQRPSRGQLGTPNTFVVFHCGAFPIISLPDVSYSTEP
jgi:hypothetical protein